MLRLMAVLFAMGVLCSPVAGATCMDKLQPGDYGARLSCLLEELQKHPDFIKPTDLVQTTFYVYIINSNHPAVERFLKGVRSGQPEYSAVTHMKEKLLQKYTFAEDPVESAATWAMIPQDARSLFVFSLADPGLIPTGIVAAVKLAIYEDLDRYFLLGFAQNQSFGVLPQNEYARLKSVLEQMADSTDPYLTAVNFYYQGLVCLNLGGWETGRGLIEDSQVILRALISSTQDRLSRKRILRNLAAASDVLGNDEEAKGAYYSLLQIDPQDWTAIMNLSYLLNEKGECNETSIWVEATLPPRQELFDITIHCGSREIPQEEFRTEPPAIAQAVQSRRSSS